MSMRELLNAARREAAQVMGDYANTRLGIIRSYDKGNYSVRVEVQPEGNLTGWIPLLSPWVGNGWGMFCPPSIGDLVELEFQESDHDCAMSCMRFFNDKNRPLPVPSGEFWLVHKSGSFLKFHNDGMIEIHAAGDINATVAGNLNAAVTGNITSSATQWNHTGPQHITGNVVITGTQQVTGQITGQGGMAISGGSGATVAGNVAITGGNVTADGIGLKTHTHSDPQGGTVGAPQ